MSKKEDRENKAGKDKNTKDTTSTAEQINDAMLYEQASTIIEEQRCRAGAFANREITLMFWKLGRLINSVVLGNERAEYGKRAISTLSAQLMTEYGSGFSKQNLYRMMLFAEQFTDSKIVSELARKLSWSHFSELLSLKSDEARMYYANDAVLRKYGTKELRRQITRKAYERLAGEEEPIGIILCATAKRGEIELLELDQEMIAVAEYWTKLPPKEVFERKIREILQEAREQLERRRTLPKGLLKQIDYFLEENDDEEEGAI